MAGHKKNYLLRAILYLALSIFTMVFYTFWRSNPIAGIIVSLIFFYLVIDLLHQKTLFLEFCRFHWRDLRYLLPNLLEWLIALPIHFIIYSDVTWHVLPSASSKELLSGILLKLLLVVREEIGTSFCWLMIAFLIMKLFKVKALSNSHIRIILIVFCVFFAAAHFPNAVAIAHQPDLELTQKILGIAFVFIDTFILGLFIKTTYVRTRNIYVCIAIHFLINLRGGYFPITNEWIGYEALILVIYIIALIFLWRKPWKMEALNKSYSSI